MVLRLLSISVILFSCFYYIETEKNNIDYNGFSYKSIVLTGYSRKEVKQNDTLAILTLKVPARLDTFYQWTHFSDCVPCGTVKYRFADSKYPQFKELGWYWD